MAVPTFPVRLFALFALLLAGAAQGADKVALVIGNADYAIGRLKNPVNDATDVSARLKQLGFEVTTLTDADRRTMEGAIRAFTRKLGKDTVGLFYFAGHGVEVDRQNYILPVGGSFQTEADVRYDAVNAGKVLDGMMRADNRLNLVILDACRNNPYTRGFRSVTTGLAEMRPASGALVLYAAEPGEQAADGEGRNGVFTESLLAAMGEPGLKIEEVFKKTALTVHGKTGGEQTPWSEGGILGDFYLVPGTTPPKPPVTPGLDAELLFWQATIQCGTPVCYQEYLKAYPQGRFAGLARARVGPPPVPVVQPPKLTDPATLEDRLGLDRDERRHIQQGLNALSHDVGGADGIWGRRTREGIAAWQRQAGLVASGYLDFEGYKQLLAQAEGPLREQQRAEAERRAREEAERRRSSALAGEMVAIPAGCFQMGSPGSEEGRESDERQHRVCVEAFRMGKTEVTVGQFRAFVEATGYRTDAEKDAGGEQGCFSLKDNQWGYVDGRYWKEVGFEQQDDYPVACVSWNDANAYIAWLNRESGGGYRLPTEAEWEYAARAGTSTVRFWGDALADACGYANVADENTSRGTRWGSKFPCDDGQNYAAPVGSFRPNGYGLNDMLGNVWEWTCSAYDENYGGDEQRCIGNNHAGRVAYRGGGWYNYPAGVRSASRSGLSAADRSINLGLRLAQD